MAGKRRRDPGAPLAGPAPGRQRCGGITAKGKPCKRWAADGADRCPVHLGAPVGRVSKLSQRVTDKICEVLRRGGYTETAAIAAGVGKATFYTWYGRGDPVGKKKTDAPFRTFREQIDQARAEGENHNVSLIANAAPDDWRAAAWMLERQHPHRWSKRTSTTAVHPDDFAAGETSSGPDVEDDQLGPDGRPL